MLTSNNNSPFSPFVDQTVSNQHGNSSVTYGGSTARTMDSQASIPRKEPVIVKASLKERIIRTVQTTMNELPVKIKKLIKAMVPYLKMFAHASLNFLSSLFMLVASLLGKARDYFAPSEPKV